MIDLTPLEVRQKKGDFRRSFRGYDAELVNDFLDLVADRMEELVKQQMALSDSVESMEEELEDYREKERALSEALMTAQKLREDARSHAEKEGQLMIREARAAAESARQEASQALAREEETLRQVRARRGHLVQSFRRLLERELGELEVIEEALELERPDRPGSRPAGPRTSEPGEGKASKGAGELELEPAGPQGAGSQESQGSRPEAPADSDVRERPDGSADGGPDSPDGSAAGGADERPVEEMDPQEDWLKSLVEE